MSPFGLKVWQGQCTLISRPRLVSEGKTRAEGYGELTFFPRGHYPSFAFGGKSNKVRCEGKTRGVPLTSVHQPFPHCLGNIKGDPLRRSLGQDVLAPDVALFGFGVVFLKDLWEKMKMWASCINSFSHTHTHRERTRAVCLNQTLQDALGQMSTPNGKSDSQCWYPSFAS